jgi:hypothetical protein
LLSGSNFRHYPSARAHVSKYPLIPSVPASRRLLCRASPRPGDVSPSHLFTGETMLSSVHKPLFCLAALLCCAAFPSSVLHAQTEDGPPNVLVFQREYLKPGKGGMSHERSESAFVRAFAGAKYPTHYFALDSMSGVSRALFFIPYDSFADWEKDNASLRANKALNTAIDHAQLMDGDLLSSFDSGAAMLRPDLSLNKGHIRGTHYFEITTFVVKPGHENEFEELAHIYADGFRKVAPDAHWDCFELIYGTITPGIPTGSTFIVMNLMKSLAEVDKGNANFKKFADEEGASGMKKISELTAASIETTSTSLFEINPRMSYPPQQWIDNDPGFWKVAPPPTAKNTASANP